MKIPAGVDEGDRIRLSGEGEPGVNGGPPGDLYVQIHLKTHAVFQRDHDDLHCEMPVSFATAALGGEIEIPTLDGSAKIKVPAETQSGKVFRLRGKGIKGVRSAAPGDLFCHVVIETPVHLTDRQKELLREFESISEEHGERHNPRAKSWMDKVRSSSPSSGRRLLRGCNGLGPRVTTVLWDGRVTDTRRRSSGENIDAAWTAAPPQRLAGPEQRVLHAGGTKPDRL